MTDDKSDAMQTLKDGLQDIVSENQRLRSALAEILRISPEFPRSLGSVHRIAKRALQEIVDT